MKSTLFHKKMPFLTKSNACSWVEYRQTKRSTNKQRKQKGSRHINTRFKRVFIPRFAVVFNTDLFTKAEVQLNSTSRLDKFCSCIQTKDEMMPLLEILNFFPSSFNALKHVTLHSDTRRFDSFCSCYP